MVPDGWQYTTLGALYECPGSKLALYELEQVLQRVLASYDLSTSLEEDPPLVLAFTAKLKGEVPVKFIRRS